jgi:hypothetical protein
VERVRELESKLYELRHSEMGMVLIEYLKLDFERLANQCVDPGGDIVRGKAQKVKSFLKIFSPKP